MAGNKQMYRPEDEQALMAALWDPLVADDPEAFVRFVFPWGKEGTPLADFSGPKKWQIEFLREMRDHIRTQRRNKVAKLDLSTLRSAVASGRGIGKSALISWIILWMMTTRIGATVIVSANSEPQLKSVTWGELGKWHAMLLNKHWFDISATKLTPADWFGELITTQLKKGLKYYYAEGKLWSEENPDAYAGVHSQDGMMVIFDEGSGIPQPIWDVAQGYFTDPIVDRYWIAFSNPRRNEGAFFECFHAKRNFWSCRQIDARTVEHTDPKIYEGIIQEHGADSRQAKVEVYGEFPSTGEDQFITPSQIREAMTREVEPDSGAPLLMGVDVARFGDDQSVIAFRQGRDARSIPWVKMKGLDTVELVSRIAYLADKYRPDAIFVDGGGVGGGVVDQLKSLKYKVIEVQAGSSADDKAKYLNKRVEMWDRAREWLMIGAVPNDDQIYKDATGIHYRYAITTNQLQLERKDEMKRRGMASPDCFESLCQTFSRPVARNDVKHRRISSNRVRVAQDIDYSFFGR
jgi:hypothetical protein